MSAPKTSTAGTSVEKSCDSGGAEEADDGKPPRFAREKLLRAKLAISTYTKLPEICLDLAPRNGRRETCARRPQALGDSKPRSDELFLTGCGQFGPILPNNCNIGAKSAYIYTTLARSWQMSPKVGRCHPRLVKFVADLAGVEQYRPISIQIWPASPQNQLTSMCWCATSARRLSDHLTRNFPAALRFHYNGPLQINAIRKV